MAAGNEVSSTYYIQHHLQNLTFGKHPENGWSLAHSAEEAREMGFWAIHLDTMGWSIAMGLLFIWIFRKAGKAATTGVPSGLQNAVEMVVEFIENLTRATFHGRNPVIAPLALTLFVWILLMNTLKIIPVDYGPELFKRLGVEYMKIVPTTDPNATLGMALGVFCLQLLIVASPLANGWFGTVSGLDPDLAKLASQAVWAALTLAAFGFGSSFFQGLLVHSHNTRSVTESVAMFLVVIVVGLAVGAHGDWLTGAIFAYIIYSLGQAAQFGWLYHRSRPDRQALGQ